MLPDYTLKMLSEDRLREASKAYARAELVREASGDNASLFQQVKHLIHLSSRPAQPSEDRPARAA
ncbi:MAG TPA: hypothetical protein VHD90_24190 [Phototrophicaceae bacterium]|nr:hypothetical protein [Phototrophicaceae bacterium]